VARLHGEAERDRELPDRDDRPAPDEDAADRGQDEREQREDAGGRRDVAERDGKRAEDAEGAPGRVLAARRRSDCPAKPS